MEEFESRWLNDVDLRTIQLVQAIETGGSMSRAAAMLGVSQPAISQHLRRAEDRLGLRLVERSERSARLSEAGRAILAVAGSVSQGLRFVSERLDEIRSIGSGRLRMTGFSSVSSIMPRLLRSIAAAHPEVSITYEENEPLDGLELVTAGERDLAVIYRYAGVPLEAEWLSYDDLHVQTLFTDELYVVLGPGHPLSDAEKPTLSEFEDDEWLLPAGPERSGMVELCRLAGFSPSSSFASDNVAARLAMVSARGSVTFVPRIALHGGVIPRDVTFRRLSPRLSREVCVVSSALHNALPLVEAVTSELRALQIDTWPVGPSTVALKTFVDTLHASGLR